MPKDRAWVCWSSGKDCAWALHVVRQQGEVDVTGLLCVVTEPYQRASMHAVRQEVLAAQADAASLPLHIAYIPTGCTHQLYEEAMGQAVRRARTEGVTHMIFGDLFLADVRRYRQTQLTGTGVAPLFPLWGRATDKLAAEMIASGLIAHITCLDPRKVPRELAGARFDEDLLARLGPDVDPCAEHGEFHTCVSAGPMFGRAIPVKIGRTVEREGFVFSDLTLGDATTGAQ